MNSVAFLEKEAHLAQRNSEDDQPVDSPVAVKKVGDLQTQLFEGKSTVAVPIQDHNEVTDYQGAVLVEALKSCLTQQLVGPEK